MSRAAIRLFLRSSLAIAAVFAVVQMAISMFGSSSLPWTTLALRALAMGAVFGLGLGTILTGLTMKTLGPDFGRQDVKLFPLRKRARTHFPLPPAEALLIVAERLREMRDVRKVETDPERLRVRAWTGVSQQSLGERVTVQLSALGPAASQVEIDSRSQFPLTLFDYGKNHRTVKEVLAVLEQEVSRRMEEQRRAAETAAMQAQLQEARLALLQAQVEPHFLYNTLANLQLLIRSDAASAERMTADLIGYLRLSMPDFRAAGFTLGRELDLTRAYLNIMKIRLGDRLAFAIRGEDGVADVKFPPLTIHTLVENAIKHGIEPRREGGRIDVDVRREADRLRVVVADTGAGFASDQSGSGVGLANLRERLQLAYGPGARVSLATNSPNGVVATLDIPFENPA